MPTNYILRMRRLLELIRTLDPSEDRVEVERELALLERELHDLANEVTIQQCRQEVERRVIGDRRHAAVPVAVDRRRPVPRRAIDLERR